LCPELRREIFVLVSALRERVPQELLTLPSGVPPDLVLRQLAQRLADNLAFAERAARWAVETWAVALRVVSEDELVHAGTGTIPAVPPAAMVEPSSSTVRTAAWPAITGPAVAAVAAPVPAPASAPPVDEVPTVVGPKLG